MINKNLIIKVFHCFKLLTFNYKCRSQIVNGLLDATFILPCTGSTELDSILPEERSAFRPTLPRRCAIIASEIAWLTSEIDMTVFALGNLATGLVWYEVIKHGRLMTYQITAPAG